MAVEEALAVTVVVSGVEEVVSEAASAAVMVVESVVEIVVDTRWEEGKIYLFMDYNTAERLYLPGVPFCSQEF